jgi:hypothetical protein
LLKANYGNEHSAAVVSARAMQAAKLLLLIVEKADSSANSPVARHVNLPVQI